MAIHSKDGYKRKKYGCIRNSKLLKQMSTFICFLRLTSVTEKCKTSLMYLGRSETIVKPPQSCPASTTISAQTGHDVKIDTQGVGGKSYQHEYNIIIYTIV